MTDQRNPASADREARLQGVLDAAVDAIITMDEDGRILSLNRAGERMMGVRESDTVGRHIRDLTDEPWRSMPTAELAVYFQRAIASDTGVVELVRGRRSDGTTLPLDMALSALREGDRYVFVGILRDVSDRLAAQERFRAVFDSSTEGHIILDCGVIADCSQAALDLFGARERSQVIGLAPSTFSPEFQPDGRRSAEKAEALLLDALASGRRRYEWTHRRLDGRDVPCEVTLTPLEVEGRSLVLAVLHDLTDRKRAERTLVEARDAAEEMARVKSRFLATMSHEIRTPMNGILGMTRLLAETPLAPDQRRYTAAIGQSAESLLAILNDVLDFSKIEAGKLRIDPLPMDLVAACEECVDLLADRAHEKGLVIVIRVAPDVPRRLIGDSGRIRQILLNLLGNAVKFTSEGSVILDVEVVAHDADAVTIRCAVTDTGIGIPLAKQPLVFQEFSQADASHTRQFGGTGLGLVITRRLAELMDGSAGFRSEEGRGSVFWATMRLGLAPEVDRDPAARLAERRIVLAEPEPLRRDALRRTLEAWRMEVVEAEDGEGVRAALVAAVAAGHPPIAALVPSGLRDARGRALAEALADEGYQVAGTPLICLMRPRERQEDDPAASGFLAVLAAPVRRGPLAGALRRAANLEETTAPALAAHRRSLETLILRRPDGRRRVLVAEDNPINQVVAQKLLEKFGCDVTVAGTGEEALACLGREPFEMVFMDVQMPVLDGLTATERWRRHESEREGTAMRPRVAIVAMTANAMQGDRERCLAAGMDDYLPKPLVFEDVRAALERWVPRHTPPSTPAIP